MRHLGLLTGVVVVMLVGGCSRGDAEPPAHVADVYRELVDATLQRDPSALEAEVLQDYEVTDEEYFRAREAQKRCVEESGHDLSVSWQESGQTTIEWPSGFSEAMGGQDAAQAVVDAVMSDCSVGTTSTIEPVYFGMRDNPEGLSGPELIRACYARHGIEDGQGLRDEEFMEAYVGDESYLAAHPAAQECVADPHT